MATKKQKHAAALAKRSKFMEQIKEIGLEAQKRSKSYQELERQQIAAEANTMNQRFNDILAAANKPLVSRTTAQMDVDRIMAADLDTWSGDFLTDNSQAPALCGCLIRGCTRNG
jgi:hypothetical protein